jgi:hypothetical protein
MTIHKMASPKRGRMFSFRMREESEKRLDELAEYRCSMNLNSKKCDIFSQAIDELYEREIGNFKPKVTK